MTYSRTSLAKPWDHAYLFRFKRDVEFGEDKQLAANQTNYDERPHQLIVAKTGLRSASIQLGLLGLYGVNTSGPLASSKLYLFFYSALALCNILRLITSALIQRLESPSQNWVHGYRALSFLAGLGWSICQIVLIIAIGLPHAEVVVGFTIIAGLCAWSTLSLAHAPKSCRFLVSLVILPMAGFLVDLGTLASISIAASFVLYFVFLQLYVSAQQASLLVAEREAFSRKQYEEGLVASEARATAMMYAGFDNVPGIIWILDQEGAPIFFNKKGLEYLGLSPAEFGGGWFSAIHPEDVEASGKSWFEAKAKQVTCETSFRLRRASDGVYRWHLAVSSPIRNRDGIVDTWVGSCLDVEDSKNAALERTEAGYREQAALESGRLKSEFLANMSHEIRTPLNGILGAAEMLADEAVTESQKKYTRILEQSGVSLMSIINDVLDFSKIEAGKLSLEVSDFDLRGVVEGQVELLTKLAIDKKISLRANIDSQLPAALKGDPGRISQILVNLIGNAIKFTSVGHVTVSAALEAPKDGKQIVRFMVEDSGIGIPVRAQERLFKPFTQADNSTARRFGGTGLGLSISKRLVELMGGEIGVISVEGYGSEFWFTLPLAEASETPAVAKADDISLPQELTNKTKLRILVAEDNSTNQILAVANLKKLGLLPHVVANGKEAIDALKREHFDLVLMDCHMPEMDGFVAAKEIRKQESRTGGHIPIVAVTASARKEDVEACREAGMDDFLAKPLRRRDLQVVLEKWLPAGAVKAA